MTSPAPLPMLGLYGGTFDPIHYGHILPVLDAAEALKLDRVALMPAHIPPHKGEPGASSEQRLAMVNKVCELYSLFYADDRELKRNKASYTFDTISELRLQYPDTSLCFFMGLDSLYSFHQWHRWQELADLCHLIVCARPGHKQAMPAQTRALLEQRQVEDVAILRSSLSGHILLANTRQVDISATQIRQCIRQHQDYEALVPSVVKEYIESHRLYR